MTERKDDQRWYAVTDAEWPWDHEEDDGPTFICLATSPEQALDKAVAYWFGKGAKGEFGGLLKVATINTVGSRQFYADSFIPTR